MIISEFSQVPLSNRHPDQRGMPMIQSGILARCSGCHALSQLSTLISALWGYVLNFSARRS